MTGGAGFIGSHLCRALITRGHRVTVLDNLLTGRAENLEGLEVELVEQDVCLPVSLPGPFDAVIHMASPASPAAYQRHPIETLEAGSLGTRNMLELARDHRALFLLTSTSEVYGDPQVHPQPEDYRGSVNPVGPRSMYDEAKRFAEALATAYARSRGVEVRIARIFNTYGPRMQPDDGRLVSNFLTQALEGRPLTIYGDGTQTRSFCYVDDMVEGLLRLLESNCEGPVNLGNPGECSILEMAQLVREVSGRSVELEFLPLPGDDPRRRCPDISRARRELGWEPEVPLREGLRRTWEWFVQRAART